MLKSYIEKEEWGRDMGGRKKEEGEAEGRDGVHHQHFAEAKLRRSSQKLPCKLVQS